jgi:hypothetical protein
MLRRGAATFILCALFAAACGNNGSNPFSQTTLSRPPSADAVLLFLSGSWSSTPGQGRELLALNADGSTLERLTNCAETDKPCDFVDVAPSPVRTRVAAVRTTVDAEAGANALYFMDLSRSVETIIVQRRVGTVDWSPDGTFLLYTSVTQESGHEDLFYVAPDGTGDQNLSSTPTISERAPRIDPFSRTAVYEHIDEAAVPRVYLYPASPLTDGPATGPALPGTPYVVGSDADPVFSPDGTVVAFRRLTGTGNGGLGTWDLLSVSAGGGDVQVIASGGDVYRGAPDWSIHGLLYVETDATAGESRLVTIRPDGTGRTVLRTEPSDFRMASPRWLASP